MYDDEHIEVKKKKNHISLILKYIIFFNKFYRKLMNPF
jgi:hypothetical protein